MPAKDEDARRIPNTLDKAETYSGSFISNALGIGPTESTNYAEVDENYNECNNENENIDPSESNQKERCSEWKNSVQELFDWTNLCMDGFSFFDVKLPPQQIQSAEAPRSRNRLIELQQEQLNLRKRQHSLAGKTIEVTMDQSRGGLLKLKPLAGQNNITENEKVNLYESSYLTSKKDGNRDGVLQFLERVNCSSDGGCPMSTDEIRTTPTHNETLSTFGSSSKIAQIKLVRGLSSTRNSARRAHSMINGGGIRTGRCSSLAGKSNIDETDLHPQFVVMKRGKDRKVVNKISKSSGTPRLLQRRNSKTFSSTSNYLKGASKNRDPALCDVSTISGSDAPSRHPMRKKFWKKKK